MRDFLIAAGLWAAAVGIGVAVAIAVPPAVATSPQVQTVRVEAEEHLPSPGGSWTRPRQPGATYIAPAWHLDPDRQLDFYTGMSFFRLPWVRAPSSTTARDGLGPLFNAHSCESCHRNGGRGRSLLDDPHSAAVVARISVEREGRLGPHPRYGSQLQRKATFRPDGQGEGSVTMSVEDVPRPDGSSLRAPRITIALHDSAEPTDHWRVSARVAPALLGLGLIEAIPAADVMAGADTADADGNGVSGRPHWRGDGESRALGRFGWKALHATVASQTGAAFRDDIGITNPAFPAEVCTQLQATCASLPTGAGEEGVEIPAKLFDYVVHFVSHMPPPRAGKLDERVQRGRALFSRVGCADCHRPHFETVYGRIWPYTDLLLHDMGPGLADRRPEGDASGSEWRTPPLWGVGTQKKVSGHTTLLHDGRARNVREAILWHGGEGAASRSRFLAARADEQRDLIAFVRAI